MRCWLRCPRVEGVGDWHGRARTGTDRVISCWGEADMATVVCVPVRSREFEFDNGDLVDGVLKLAHGLHSNAPSVPVYDNNGMLVIVAPEVVDEGNVDVDLKNAVPIAGAWRASVLT